VNSGLGAACRFISHVLSLAEPKGAVESIRVLKKENNGDKNTVEPGYNNIYLYDTSSVAPDILCYQLIPRY
jgi:hypothetical protein